MQGVAPGEREGSSGNGKIQARTSFIICLFRYLLERSGSDLAFFSLFGLHFVSRLNSGPYYAYHGAFPARCFAEDSRVILLGGERKKIVDVSLGDYVLSSSASGARWSLTLSANPHPPLIFYLFFCMFDIVMGTVLANILPSSC